MNKIGQVEPVVIVVFLLFIGIIFFTVLKIMNAQADTDTTGMQTNVRDGWASGLNIGLIIGVGFLFVGAIIAAKTTNINPIFIWVILMFFIVISIVIWNLAPTYSTVVNNQTFSREIGQVPQGNNILSNIGKIIIGLMIIFFVFIVRRGGEQ